MASKRWVRTQLAKEGLVENDGKLPLQITSTSDQGIGKISAGDFELLQMSAQSGTVDADVAVNNAVAWAPFTLDRPMLVNRVQGKVGTADPQKNMEIAIYSADLKKLASTGIQEIPVAGYFEFAVPETALQTGKYFFAMSCKSAGTATFGHTMRHGGFTSFIRHPISETIVDNLQPSASFPALVALGRDLPAPSGWVLQAYANVNVLNVSGDKLRMWGTRAGSKKFAVSTDGIDWTDGPPKSPNIDDIWCLEEYGGKLYITTMNLNTYVSSDLTPAATWTDISVPTTAGMRRERARARAYSQLLWNDYLIVGEYSGITNGEVIEDPVDPSGPRLFKYGPLSGTPAWSLVYQFDQARHIHAVYADGQTGTRMWVVVGDGGYDGPKGQGLYRISDIVNNTVVRWSPDTTGDSFSAEMCPTDVFDLAAGSYAPLGLYAASDNRGVHVQFMQYGSGVGAHSVGPRIFINTENKAVETARGLVIDTLGNKNMYWFSGDSPAKDMWVSPPPYTQSARLGEAKWGVYKTLAWKGLIWNYEMCWTPAKFPWQKT